ncbi:glycosyltransferase family 39 protein [Saccharomonospora sp. NPDC006951]
MTVSASRVRDPLPRFAVRGVGVVVMAQATLLTALSGRYGFHRDELYFLAAGDRPAWGYVDQPPLTPMLVRLATELAGASEPGIRVVSTVVAAATVALVALVARELGGGGTAQTFAAFTAAISSLVLVVGHMVSTTTLDVLLWLVVALLLIRLLRTGDHRWWLAVGAAAGVALLNKWLVVLLVLAVGIALLLVGPRPALRSRLLVAGAGIALVIAAPTLVWQLRNGFPLLTVAGGISADDGAENRIMFLPLQIAYLSPALVPVWIAGMVRLWRERGPGSPRAMALAYPLLVAVLLVVGGKPYYSIPLLLVLLAAGAEPTLNWLARGRVRVAAASALAVLASAGSVVVALPVLPATALDGPVLAMNKEQGEQVGWPEFVTTVARVWDEIPAGRRETATIFTASYGQAGAIEHYGPARGLPVPHSGHMSYADWGPPADRLAGPVVLVGAAPGGRMVSAFTGCELAAVHRTPGGVGNNEDGTAVMLCEGTTLPWSSVWPSLRHFY